MSISIVLRILRRFFLKKQLIFKEADGAGWYLTRHITELRSSLQKIRIVHGLFKNIPYWD